MAGYKIFTGAQGYYVAFEGEAGSHIQPLDNGSRIGWNRKKAERILAQSIAEQQSIAKQYEDEQGRLDHAIIV